MKLFILTSRAFLKIGASFFSNEIRTSFSTVLNVEQLNFREFLVWISDTSCNVVFVDEVSAALALKSVSQPFRISIHRPDSMGDRDASPHSRRKTTRSAVEFDVDTGEEVSVSTLGAFPLPVPRGVWRVARTPPAKAKQLLFRFARNSDKMPEIVTDRSQYFYGLAGKPRSAGHSRAQNGSISRYKMMIFSFQNTPRSLQCFDSLLFQIFFFFLGAW